MTEGAAAGEPAARAEQEPAGGQADVADRSLAADVEIACHLGGDRAAQDDPRQERCQPPVRFAVGETGHGADRAGAEARAAGAGQYPAQDRHDAEGNPGDRPVPLPAPRLIRVTPQAQCRDDGGEEREGHPRDAEQSGKGRGGSRWQQRRPGQRDLAYGQLARGPAAEAGHAAEHARAEFEEQARNTRAGHRHTHTDHEPADDVGDRRERQPWVQTVESGVTNSAESPTAATATPGSQLRASRKRPIRTPAKVE
nr:hypothetical protein [Amycolatopsis sp. Hca4]